MKWWAGFSCGIFVAALISNAPPLGWPWFSVACFGLSAVGFAILRVCARELDEPK